MPFLARIKAFFTNDLWKTRTRDMPFPRRVPIKFLKIALLSARSFQNDLASIRAAALTLYTLLSVVPVTALLFGIAKGFGLDANLETWLYTQFAEQRDVVQQTVVFARRALDGAEGGLVAGAGVAFLIYSVVNVIGNIEQSFNQIWSVAKARPWGRKFTDYLSLILVGPFLIIGSSSMTVYVATLLNRAAEAAPLGWLVSPATRIALMAAPLMLLWLLFSFIYVFVPNTKVRIPSAVFGGALAAVSYQVVQSFYIHLQVGVSRTNAIYGTFAALPLFLIWLFISWRIVLLGAEFTHQHQNYERNELEERIPDLSFRAVKRLALGISDYVSGRFLRAESAPTAEAIGTDLRIPTSVLGNLLDRMCRARILVEVAGPEPVEPAYHPARDPHKLTPAVILEALETLGEDLAEANGNPLRTDPYAEMLEEFDRCLNNHPVNRPLTPLEKTEGGRGPGESSFPP